MSWIEDFSDLEAARARTQTALRVPIGLSSPLWAAFGAATTAGLAFWWATRWARALNIEAIAGAAELAEAAELAQPSEIVGETAPETLAVVAIEADEVEAEAPEVEEAHEVSAVEAVADDLTRLSGVGHKLAAALAERGVTTFAQLAAWSDEEARTFDAELGLMGRVMRDAWVAQARGILGEV
jgi:predicted flap endonuclease-1-like 5' DNA nuclease